MPLSLQNLTAKSPYLYHVTYRSSLDRIRRLKKLESAATLMQQANRRDLLRIRREDIEPLCIEGDTITLTDQKPVNEKNIAFQGGWTLADLIEAINVRVFFWRSDGEELHKRDKGQPDKYRSTGQSLVFLRLSFRRVIDLNADRGPQLCKYNSGAARKQKGEAIPRGPDTFVRPEVASFDVDDVREVVFQNHVVLPATTEWCEDRCDGPWNRLF